MRLSNGYDSGAGQIHHADLDIHGAPQSVTIRIPIPRRFGLGAGRWMRRRPAGNGPRAGRWTIRFCPHVAVESPQ